ncbi:Interleukin-20 receptor subunit beta [Nibea albiflora]|nr:Interleukin-20 receptor subunit beta [Nibea albiflora]
MCGRCRLPSRVSMESVDMRHVLKWRPPQASCGAAVLYSVQFQGEFELTVWNGSWVDAPECQLTAHTHCDLTFDLGSDSDYNLRVRAQCESQRSAWTKLSPAFNRRHTVLMAPEMAVTAVGDTLHVAFDKLPLTAVVMVTVWKRGGDLQVQAATTTNTLIIPCSSRLLIRFVWNIPVRSRRRVEEADHRDCDCDHRGRSPVRCVLVHRSTAVQTPAKRISVKSRCRSRCILIGRSPTPMSPEEAELCEAIHVVPSAD